ncbi:MAG TPA: hypothetical protein VMD92_02790 [Acidobacteriaceae bacterium]|nr:hypothetical protein [Acidobacteriaceae bacterium]
MRTLQAFLPIAALLFAAVPRCAAAQSPEEIVSTVVSNEIKFEAADHSRWMYRDAYKSPEKDTVKLIIQTPQGNLSEIIEDHGQPPSPQEHQADLAHMQQLVVDPALRERQRRAEAHDGQQADDLMRMLPNAFLWQITGRDHGMIILASHPNPKFSPPSMSARVLASMSGSLFVDEHTMRLVKLTGRLMQPINFGWGLLGHLDAGGTFEIVRTEIAPGEWQITQSHIHISGHALFFKTIGDQEDEVTSDYRPVPDGVDLDKAAEMIRSGQLARDLDAETHFQ